MAEFISLHPEKLVASHTIDPRLVSYNVEMTEITGGTFWKSYSDAQIEGTEPFSIKEDVSNILSSTDLMQWYDPIDLYDPKLRKMARELGTAWVRVSGSWATKTYYDFDGHTNGIVPEGFQGILTKDQWIGVLDFVKAIDGKLMISVGNCSGNHPDNGPLDLSQSELIFQLSQEYGVPIDAAEFMNEPNMLERSGAPAGYTPADFVRDQDIFNNWVKNNYPDCLVVGPCSTDSDIMKMGNGKGGAGIADIFPTCSTEELLAGSQCPFDVFSYHYYNGVSERLESMAPAAHWEASEAATEEYLATSGACVRGFAPYRDKYAPGAQMWVTESGDAGGGGNTWASTYLDVLRTLNELGDFASVTDGVIFHNTFASSDYGFLQHGTFDPRPNYFAAKLWNHLMGSTVYQSGEPIREGAHVFAHSRKDGKEGFAYLIINNSLTEVTTVELPKEALRYTLTGEKHMRSTVMCLNGTALRLTEDGELPSFIGEPQSAGTVTLAPGSCTFFVL